MKNEYISHRTKKRLDEIIKKVSKRSPSICRSCMEKHNYPEKLAEGELQDLIEEATYRRQLPKREVRENILTYFKKAFDKELKTTNQRCCTSCWIDGNTKIYVENEDSLREMKR